MMEPVICACTTAILPAREDEESQHQLGDAAEADIEKPADRAAGALRDLLGGPPHPISKHRDRDRAGPEDQKGGSMGRIPENKRNGDEEQQEMGRRHARLPRATAPARPAARWQIWSRASFAGTGRHAICCCCSGKARPRDGTLSRSEAALSPHILNFLADLGGTAVLGPAIVAACATLLACGRRRDAVAWALAFSACTAATVILKTLVGEFAISILGCRIQAGAFPSGHAGIGVVFYGGLAMLLWRGSRAPFPRTMASRSCWFKS